MRMIFAGMPPAKQCDGMSFVTTAPAAIRAPSPIVTPEVTLTWEPSHAPQPMVIGAFLGVPKRNEVPDR